jgi:hypothetical protein
MLVSYDIPDAAISAFGGSSDLGDHLPRWQAAKAARQGQQTTGVHDGRVPKLTEAVRQGGHMIKAAFVKVREDKVDRLRAWSEELQVRAEEVRDAFAEQSTNKERAYLVHGLEAPILVLVYDFDDAARAHEAFRDSTLAIDQDYKQVMDEVMDDALDAEVLYEVARLPG